MCKRAALAGGRPLFRLVGGVPRAEVEAKRSLFAAHGVEVTAFFVERDIEARRAEAADRLRQTFGRLGYEPDGRGTP